jgi:polar amino acid transport system substrate-binding protein
MLQVLQDQKSGKVLTEEVPIPNCHPKGILVKVHNSTISAGTEKASVDNAKGSLLERARKQPDQVKVVIDTLKQHGVKSTIDRVRNKLNSYKALGYSAAGEVIQSNVDEFKIGDRVAIGGAGLANHAELVSIPKNLAVKLPENVSYNEGSYATVGSIAMQGVRQAEPELGETVAVIGLGLLGIITVQLLKASGCRVVGLDINEGLFDQAKKYGCDEVYKSSRESLGQIESYTRGLGFDSVIITAGTQSSEPLNLSMEITRKKGKIVVVGAIGLDLKRNPWYTKEINLRISCSYGPGRYDSNYEELGQDYPAAYVRWTENRNMQSFLDMISMGRVDVDSMTSHSFAIEEASKAYELIESGKPFLGINLEYNVKKRHISKYKLKDKELKKAGENVSFIGCGSFAQNYLIPPLKKIGLNFYGVATSSPLSASAASKVHNFMISSTDSLALINDKNSEIIFIASRHDSHSKYVLEAMNAGKAVFVEKPLAITEAELMNIREMQKNRNSQIMVGYNRRFSKPFMKMKEFIGRSGQPIHVAYRINAGKIPKDHWSQHEEQGGRIIGELCHFIDSAIYFTGSLVRSVYAESFSGTDTSMINDDNVTVTLKMENGSTAKIDYIASGGKAMPKEFVEIFGNGRSCVMSNFEKVSYYTTNEKTDKFNGKKGIDEEISETIKAFQAGKSAPIDFSELYNSALSSIKIVESIKSGTKINL